jgi:hypothetical protein
MDLKAYAAAASKKYTTLATKRQAWDVFGVTNVRNAGLPDDWVSFSIIRAAPQWLWPALVEKMTSEAWTVATTREKVGRCL